MWKSDGSYYGYYEQIGGGSTPIVNGAFQDALAAGGSSDYSGSYFKGSFTGTQASGTLYVHESHQAVISTWPRWITGTVTTTSHVLTWTATSASAPQLTNVTQSATSWRLGSEPPKLARAKPPVGTTFAFTLNQPARVWFFFTYRTIGRLVGGKCLAQSNANRGRARCLRTVRVSFSRQANAGRTRLRFQGRLDRKRKLPPGLYKLIIGATANERWSKPAILRFTILP